MDARVDPDRCKAIYVARFRDGMPRAEARRYWTEVHAPMAEPLHDMIRYVQNHAVAGLASPDPAEAGFDGYACEWWTDRASFDAGMRTDAWRRVVDDGPMVFDPHSLTGMSVLVRERVVVDGAAAPFKLAFFARFADGLDPEAADAHWRGDHAELARRLPGLRRYVQNVVIATLGAAGEQPGFDACAEMWFDDRAAYERCAASPAWEALGRDASSLLDPTMAGVVEERVIKGG